MKKYIIGVIILLASYSLNAQRVVEKQIVVKPTSGLDLKLDFTDTIRIKKSNDNTLRVKAIVNINDNQHNDKYELITTEGSDLIKVKAKIYNMESIKIPCKKSSGSSYNYHNGECLTMDISYVIEVPSIASLRIETISGDIIIDNASYPMLIKSISGFIDLSISAKANSELKIETVTGGVYTNHEFNKSMDKFEGNPRGTDANFRLGTGENRIKLTTVSGDIFVREI